MPIDKSLSEVETSRECVFTRLYVPKIKETYLLFICKSYSIFIPMFVLFLILYFSFPRDLLLKFFRNNTRSSDR